jgi:hypothetical protein
MKLNYTSQTFHLGIGQVWKVSIRDFSFCGPHCVFEAETTTAKLPEIYLC